MFENRFGQQKSTLVKFFIEKKEFELKEAQNNVVDRNFVLQEKKNELEKVLKIFGNENSFFFLGKNENK